MGLYTDISAQITIDETCREELAVQLLVAYRSAFVNFVLLEGKACKRFRVIHLLLSNVASAQKQAMFPTLCDVERYLLPCITTPLCQ